VRWAGWARLSTITRSTKVPSRKAHLINRLEVVHRLPANHNRNGDQQNGRCDATAAQRFERIVLNGSGLLYLTTASYALVTHEMAGQERLLGFAALGFTILFGVGLRYGARWVRAKGRTRTTLRVWSTILGIGWFTCFMLLILPHHELTISQLVVALFWAFVPIAGSGAFAVGLEETKVRRAVGSVA
jgi:hypothetical protein